MYNGPRWREAEIGMAERRESPLGTEAVIQKGNIGPLSSGRFPARRNENCQEAQNFIPTVLIGTDEGGLQVVADLVEVLRATE